MSTKRALKGFTLLELAISMLVAGILAIGYLSYKQFNLDSTAQTETLKKIKVIEDALLTYVGLYGRLPCPANPSEAIGSSNFGVGNCSTTGTNILSVPLTGDTLYYGTIPTYDLNIANDYTFDGWNNRLFYAVQGAFASCNTAGAINNATPQIKILTGSGGTTISNQVAYVIVSTGPDGYGSYLRNADRNTVAATDGPNTNQNPNPNNTSSDEWLNLVCNPNTSTCTSTFVAHPPTSNFDDIVVYKERYQVAMECNAYFNNSCSGTWTCP